MHWLLGKNHSTAMRMHSCDDSGSQNLGMPQKFYSKGRKESIHRSSEERWKHRDKGKRSQSSS